MGASCTTEGERPAATAPHTGRRLLPVLFLALILCLALVAHADGATRHAAPGGAGPAASCPAADPCSIEDAVEDPSVDDGDVIHLADGTYELTHTLTVGDNVVVSGSRSVGAFGDGFEGALISSSADPAVFVIPTEARLMDLEIANTGSGRGLLLVNGLVERTRVRAAAGVACEVGSVDAGNAIMTNTACLGGEGAVVTRVDAPGSEFAVLDAVTAVAAGGPAVLAVGEGPGAQARISASNLIAQGVGGDVRAETDGSGGAAASAELEASAYVNVVESGPATSVTPAGTAGNPAIRARFLDLAGGDVRQLPNSPTIDRGRLTTRLGFGDFEGDRRTQNGAPDIGADESTDRRRLLKVRLNKRLPVRKTISFRGECEPTSCVVKGSYRIKLRGRKKRLKGRYERRELERRGETTFAFELRPKLKRKLRKRGGRLKVRLRAEDPTGVVKVVKRRAALARS